MPHEGEPFGETSRCKPIHAEARDLCHMMWTWGSTGTHAACMHAGLRGVAQLIAHCRALVARCRADAGRKHHARMRDTGSAGIAPGTHTSCIHAHACKCTAGLRGTNAMAPCTCTWHAPAGVHSRNVRGGAGRGGVVQRQDTHQSRTEPRTALLHAAILSRHACRRGATSGAAVRSVRAVCSACACVRAKEFGSGCAMIAVRA